MKVVDGAVCLGCKRTIRIRPKGWVSPYGGQGPTPCSYFKIGKTWKRDCDA